MAKHGEAAKIEPLNTSLLANKSPIKTTDLICPRDRAKLVRFTDKYFPQDIVLVRCPTCSGMWLNRGEFTKFQTARLELQRYRGKVIQSNIKFEEDIKKILEAHRGSNTSETLANLGKFLSTPVDELSPQAADGPGTAKTAQSAMDTVLSILSLVLSAVLRIKPF